MSLSLSDFGANIGLTKWSFIVLVFKRFIPSLRASRRFTKSNGLLRYFGSIKGASLGSAEANLIVPRETEFMFATNTEKNPSLDCSNT